MKAFFLVLAIVIFCPHVWAQDDLNFENTSTAQLRDRVVRLRTQYIVACPAGLVGAVLSAGVQLVPIVSTMNVIIGRSEDWRSADWATQESFIGVKEHEIYVASIGGVLTPVYDILALNNFRATRASLRVLAAQESRMIGRRSTCVRDILLIREIKKELRRRESVSK